MQNENAKKNNLIPQELDALIQEYLTDGIISSKERNVLLNKAQKLGLDVEEVDLYIDAQQQKADQAVSAAQNKRRGKTCPYCGAAIPELADKCPECGQIITAEASEELEEIFEKLETSLVDYKDRGKSRDKAEVERYVRKAKMYYGGNPKIKQLLVEVEKEISKAAKTERGKKIYAWWIRNNDGIILLVAFLVFAVLVPILVICFGGKGEDDKRSNENTEQTEQVEEIAKVDPVAIVQNTAKEVHEALDNGDVDKAAKLLKRCEVGSLDDDTTEGATYKSTVSEVVDAYLENEEKKKAQDLVTTCAMKFRNNYDLKELYEKLGGEYYSGFED